jgi:hypothetical protein
MNPLTLLLKLPLLPLRVLMTVAQVIQQEAERQRTDPATIRRQLEQAEYAMQHGEMSETEVARTQAEAVASFLPPRPARAGEPDSDEG